jgi:hypothetical protein
MFRQADAILTGMLALGLALATAVLAGTVGCAGLPRGGGAERSVTAEGWAPADARDMDGTRRRALADALRRAVEQVSGVSLSALTRVEGSVALRQKISAEVRGRVSRYEVLGEESEGGLLKVRIRAAVRLGEAPAAGPPPADARVSLRVSGSGLYDEDMGGSAASGIRRELLTQGFEVTDSTGQALALRGETSAIPVRDLRLGAFHCARARVRLRAVEPGTGAVVWETEQEASALDLDPGLASAKAARAAGALLGRRAGAELAEVLWKRF